MSSTKQCNSCEVELVFNVPNRRYYVVGTTIGHSHCRNCSEGIFWNPDVVSESGKQIPLEDYIPNEATGEFSPHDCPESDYNKRGVQNRPHPKTTPAARGVTVTGGTAPTVPPVHVDKKQETLAIDAQGALIAISRSFILNNEQNEKMLDLLDKIAQNIEALAKTEFAHLVPKMQTAGELITDPQKAKQVFEDPKNSTVKVTETVDWEKESRELEQDMNQADEDDPSLYERKEDI